MKQCKQCLQTKSLEGFRQYYPRGTGRYNTKQGYYTICKDCESISRRVAHLLKNDPEHEDLVVLKAYYEALGAAPCTKPARQLLGLDTAVSPGRRGTVMDLVRQHTVPPAVDAAADHLDKLRARTYSDVDTADREHRRLEAVLRESNLYEQCADLLDEWFME